MPIESAMVGVAASTEVLSEHNLGRRRELLQQVLPLIKRHDTKSCYSYGTPPDAIKFNYIVENKILYLCITDNEEGMRVPFTYLGEISQKFKADFGGGGYPDTDELSRSRCKAFDSKLKERMSFCNDQDKIKSIQKDIEEVKGVMMENIDAVIQRGDKIDDLVDKSTELEGESTTFKKGATKLKRDMQWRNARMIIGIIVLLLVIIAIIVAAVCATGSC